MMAVRIIEGDCRAVLATLPAASVHCAVTSPPYWGLRDYGVAGQIGLERTLHEYVAEMVAVFREVRRALRDDGTVFLNLGDCYFNTSAGGAQGKSGQRAGRTFTATGSGGVRRAASCDKPGKEPANSPARDCLCGNLCDACRGAYRLGRFHSVLPHVPTLSASTQASSREHIESECVLLPTSDCPAPRARSAGAIADLLPTVPHEAAPPADAQASTTTECEPPPLALRSAVSSLDAECLSCGCSLLGSVPACARMEDCTCGKGGGASADRTTDMDALGLAYPSYTTSSLKPKDLAMIPARVALALQDDGWWLRSDIIWAKPNPMPESVTDRPTSAHEHIFLLTKAARYFFDSEAVREQAAPWNSSVGFNKEGQSARNIEGRIGDRADMVQSGRNIRNVWEIATAPYAEAHFATFPPELAERCIKAGTSERGCCAACGAPWERIKETVQASSWEDRKGAGHGSNRGGSVKMQLQHGATHDFDNRAGGFGSPKVERTTGWRPTCDCPAAPPVPCTVLDPFAGAGTTLLVADRLQRDGIGIELNPAYATMARNRIVGDAPLFASAAD